MRLSHDPDYMHTFADRHPQFILEDVRVPAVGRSWAAIGQADELTNEWFVEERIHIGARCTGAMERLLGPGRRVGDRAGSSSASGSTTSRGSASRWPTRPPTPRRPACSTRECAWLADSGADPKVVHARASIAKLFASEAAFRCADRVVQVFGGRGYMRENPAERFFRELRVDRIWEGTSEIQRLIIARALEKRGVGRVVGEA